MWVVDSQSDDVFGNLATEESLFASVAGRRPVLFFCRNRAAVVIGRNQCAWRECRPTRLAGEGVALARRISGGGAVSHDPGNLNYSLMLPRAAYRGEEVFAAVVSALARLGLAAERMGRTSLGVRGRKCSGNAFAFRGAGVLHHGTLLVASDLDRLRERTERPSVRITTTAVASEPAPVGNLGDWRPGLDLATVREAVLSSLAARYGPVERTVGAAACLDEPWTARRPDVQAWERVHGSGPAFTAHWPAAESAPAFSVAVEHGVIRTALLAGEPLDGLPGRPFDPAAVSRALRAGRPGDPGATVLARRVESAWR